MKSKVHSLAMGLIIVPLFVVFGFAAWGTDVGGIIYTNTTWDLAGSPYNITSTVQVDAGVTLTIDPGVVVNGGFGGTYYRFHNWGNISAIGNNSSKITYLYLLCKNNRTI